MRTTDILSHMKCCTKNAAVTGWATGEGCHQLIQSLVDRQRHQLVFSYGNTYLRRPIDRAHRAAGRGRSEVQQ